MWRTCGHRQPQQLSSVRAAMQVPDLSVVAAQAAAQVERAREAARRQMAAALSAKPKLLLHVSLDAPKVAVPIPAVGNEGELL